MTVRPFARLLGLTTALAALAAPAAQAQQTLTPAFSAPYRAFVQHEFGATISSVGDVSVEGFYGYGTRNFDVELRAGIVTFPDAGINSGGSAALLGIQFRDRVITNSRDFPLDGALTLGIGGRIGNGTDELFVPVGLTLGRRFVLEGSSTSFVTYVQPYIGPSFTNSDTSFEGGLGLGVDVRFNKQLDLRVSGGIGHVEGIAIGVAFVR